MTTVGVSQPVRRTAPGAYDRVFYSGIAIAMALTVFVGFSRTYYLPVVSGTPATFSGRSVTPTLHVHALLFSGWVLLFVAQAALVASRRVAVHRKLGYASIALAIAMIIVGLRTAIQGAARGSAPPGVDPLSFMVVPFFDIVLFAAFVSAALLNRRNKETHKRLMLLAYVSIITAAVARLPGVLPYGPPAFYGLTFIFVIAGMVYDRISRQRIHPVYLWGGALIALSVPGRLALSATAAWRSFAEFLVR